MLQHSTQPRLLHVLLLICLASSIFAKIERRKNASKKALVLDGHYIFGGLFPIHAKSSADSLFPCGEIQAGRGIQRMEAMLFAIDEINRNSSLLPNVKLGVNILDTCSRDTYALEQSLEYIRGSLSTMDGSDYQCADGSSPKATSFPLAVSGVIGGAYSSVSLQVANLLRLFRIPQISYASTSGALSDKSRFEYFARTVPPDNYQAKAMMDIVTYFNFSFVSTVASEGDYGEAGMDFFHQEAMTRNVCIAIQTKLPYKATPETFDNIIKELMMKPRARVIVLFLRVEDAKNLLLASRRSNISNHFVWIAADGWGKADAPVVGNEDVAEGAITIELQAAFLRPFDKYFKGLKPDTNTRNPWFKEYWEDIHGCKFGAEKPTARCTGQERMPSSYKQESKVQFVYDAVYALAIALNTAIQDVCHKKRKRKANCTRNVKIDGKTLYRQYLLNTTFTDKYGAKVCFDRNGDGLGRYNILNYRRNRVTRKFEYRIIGEWVERQHGPALSLREQIRWATGTFTVPVAQCSEPCQRGHTKRFVSSEKCCWVCQKCQDWQYVHDELTCKDCPMGSWPDKSKKSCYKLQLHYMEWSSVYAIVPICLSCLGICLTMVVMVTFCRHKDTPIVKASGRELSFLLLTGFLICYLVTFLLLAKPSKLICGAQRFGVGFGFSVTYASLLTKTNRISRIFHSASKSAARPACISPKSQVLHRPLQLQHLQQVVIASLLILLQVVGTGVWLFFEPAGTRHHVAPNQRDVVILKCAMQDISFLMSLIYNMLLICVCTVYAVKTRKIPENFNESKYIGFTMYTTCIIWLAFVPIYFGTLNSFQIQITTLCVSVSLSASVALLCLFTPKMYIIVFQPEKNVRRLTMNSATYKSASTNPNSSCRPSSEQIKMQHNSVTTSLKRGTGAETETDGDKDSMASL